MERSWTPPYATRSGDRQPCSKGGSRLIAAVPWLIRIACRLQKTHHTQICPEVIIPRISWWSHQVISDSISFSLLYHPQHSLLASRPPHIPRWLLSILPSHTHFKHQERQKGSTSQLYQLQQGAFPEVHFCCISWNLVLWLYLAEREDGKEILLVWFITISNSVIFLQGRKIREQILDGVSLQQLSRNVAYSKLHEDVSVQFSSIQSLSRVRLFATPWIAARQASLSITNPRSSLRLTSIESVMPSSHLILCCPLLLLPPIPPSFRVFSNESTLPMRWPKYWSFSFSIIPSKEIPGLISFRMDW